MLSDDLKSLRDRLRQYGRSGVLLQPAGVNGICAILDSAVEDAVRMECCAVRQPVLRVLEPEPAGDVVDLRHEAAQRDIRKWITGQGVLVVPVKPGGDGGDAA